ncbi:MAG: hypothetical protein H7327_13700, partial [Herminiimonas sp.]|nr:hypothetical protein [Herminiimonas sp.]
MNFLFRTICTMLMWVGMLIAPVLAHADDIDIFGGTSGGTGASTNILIVLDNTSNWSANNQGWPGGITQGQAEVASLKQLVQSVNGNASVNLGLMVFSTVSGNPGGMIVFPTVPVTSANIGAWTTWLDARYNNITDPTWKASSNANYGAAMFDVFKYFGGYTSPAHATDDVAGTPVSRTRFGPQRYADIDKTIANPLAYTSDFSSYLPPAQSSCGRNFIIFIGNGFPNADDTTLLPGVGGDTTVILPNPMDSGSKVYAADEWARFLYATDVNAFPGQENVVTYTINVFGPSPGPTQSKQAQYLFNMATFGGGTAFSAQSGADLTTVLKEAVAAILAVNDTFASASLPVNTANRSQDKNQVFIPMFRPDAKGAPRWMGNLKQYQLIDSLGSTALGDSLGKPAVNPQSGFVTDCAISYWTTDSGTYWSNVVETPLPRGKCPSTTSDPFSDNPDGPIVEKGGAAEVLRKGNNPPTTNTTPTYLLNRTIYTEVASALVPFTALTSGLSASLVSYVSGNDTQDENNNLNLVETRPSIHGDAIHSRPLPIDYGGTVGVTVFYGNNDGTFRAVDSTNGRERWAFVASEFFTGNRLARLKANVPLLSNFVSAGAGITPTPTPKDYFFDGSTGVYQTANNAQVWIYPTTRRGGRMVYALDVTNPSLPVFKWKFGCPNLADNAGCSAGASGIGQTWSKPTVVAKIAGYSRPVVIFGGGYDGCEDANTSSPGCIPTTGATVYVLDADTGVLVKSFATTRAVASDIALLSSASDGTVDTAYASDTGGNIFRIDFKALTSNWTINRIAYTSGGGRKFLYAPALLNAGGGKVYLALGSGDREHPLSGQYPYGVTNRFYVYVDYLSGTTATNLDQIKDYTVQNSCTTPDILPTSADRGYYVSLNQNGPGEQTVTSAIIVSGLAAFSTNRAVPAAQGTCSTTLGEARGYWVNLFNGAGAIGTPNACGGTRSSLFV